MRVSLSEGLYLNFNAETPLSSPIGGTGSSLMHLFMFLFMAGRTIRFDFTTLEFAGDKFSTPPLPSSSYYCPRPKNSWRGVTRPSRSIGNIAAWSNRFTALVSTFVRRFNIYRDIDRFFFLPIFPSRVENWRFSTLKFINLKRSLRSKINEIVMQW